MKNKKTMYLAVLALLLAVEIVLSVTPLGMIMLPIFAIRATTLHIPVIIAGIILGVKGGAIVGGMFGICSIISNTIAPGITSFCFSPFYSIGEFHGGFNSIIIAMVPRILLGVISALVYSVLKKHFNEYVSVIVAALSGAITNTILVLGGIYVFFGASYAAAKEISYEALLGVLMSVVSVNGLLEAAFGAIIVLAVYKACKPIINKVRN